MALNIALVEKEGKMEYQIFGSKSFKVYGVSDTFENAEKIKALAIKGLQKDKANRLRRERAQAYKDLGLVKVKGALGGTYYE